MMSRSCKRVVGIDISPKMIDYAQTKCGLLQAKNTKFICADVVEAARAFKTNEFDYATITMALHEMPKESRAPVMAAIARIARRVIAVDFVPQMPWNLPGIRNRLFEFLTLLLDWSTEHFFNFLEFREEGGVQHILEVCTMATDSRLHAMVNIEHVRLVDGGCIGIYYISTGLGPSSTPRSIRGDIANYSAPLAVNNVKLVAKL